MQHGLRDLVVHRGMKEFTIPDLDKTYEIRRFYSAAVTEAGAKLREFLVAYACR